MTGTFLAMMMIVDLSPDALAQRMFGKEVHGMARIGPDFAFAGPAGDRRAAGQSLQSLGSFLKAPSVVTDFG